MNGSLRIDFNTGIDAKDRNGNQALGIKWWVSAVNEPPLLSSIFFVVYKLAFATFWLLSTDQHQHQDLLNFLHNVEDRTDRKNSGASIYKIGPNLREQQERNMKSNAEKQNVLSQPYSNSKLFLTLFKIPAQESRSW